MFTPLYKPSHILITGASSGLGAALAEAYAEPGVLLDLHGRNTQRLETTAENAKKRGATVTTYVGDVTDAPALRSWIESCDRIKPLDLVIANAGVSVGSGQLEDSSLQSQIVFDTNITGVLNTVQPALPLMIARKRGQIAIMSSLAGFRGFAGSASYCGSKAAVRVYGEGLRGDMFSKGVHVNVVCPGYIKTPMTAHNAFPMPFLISSSRAADIIKKGLTHDKPRIVFPWPLFLMIRFLCLWPEDWINRLMAPLPKKGD